MKTKIKTAGTLHKNGATKNKTVSFTAENNLMQEILKKSENLLNALATFSDQTTQSSGSALGAKQQAFIRETFVMAQEDTSLLPHNTELEELEILLFEVNELLKIRQNLKSALERTTTHLHSVLKEEQKQASSIYASIKAKAKAGVPKMKELCDYLTTTYFKKKKSEKLASRSSLSGYMDENGNFVVKKETKHKRPRTQKGFVPEVIIPKEDLKY